MLITKKEVAGIIVHTQKVKYCLYRTGASDVLLSVSCRCRHAVGDND